MNICLDLFLCRNLNQWNITHFQQANHLKLRDFPSPGGITGGCPKNLPRIRFRGLWRDLRNRPLDCRRNASRKKYPLTVHDCAQRALTTAGPRANLVLLQLCILNLTHACGHVYLKLPKMFFFPVADFTSWRIYWGLFHINLSYIYI